MHFLLAKQTVRLVREGDADAVMKGHVNTSVLLHAVLDKEIGLRTGRLLSLCNLLEIPGARRLIMITDPGVVLAPNLSQKVQIVQNAIDVASKIGVEIPKVACLAAVETVDPNVPSTIDAAALTQMNRRGQIAGAIIDGPLAFDNAISPEAVASKGIDSEVAGQADILVVPNIEAGNMLSKAMTCCANAELAGIVAGAAAPIIVTSRADAPSAKVNSVALASFMLHGTR